MSRLFKITVRENRKIAENHYILTAHPSMKIRKPVPGQFFMISAGNGMDPLLKRPFSIHRWLGGDFQIMYRVVGRGTGLLRDRPRGDHLDVIGPLGNGFPVPEIPDKRPILVAGGIGVAPIFALAEAVSGFDPLFFYGARNADEILCADELRALGINPEVSTDDGSAGVQATVVDLLDAYLETRPEAAGTHRFYACGPGPMLRALSLLARKHGINGYMALEEMMACGLGTCQGCVVRTVHGYQRVCKEGPVFPAEEIIW